MRRVTDLLVPQGILTVEQVWQEIPGDLGETVALVETLRTPWLNGAPIWLEPGTARPASDYGDLLAAADDALALLPPAPLPVLGGS